MMSKKLLIPLIAVLAIAAAVVAYIAMNNSNNPDEVSLDKAVEGVATSPAAGEEGESTSTETEPMNAGSTAEGIDGPWIVDADSGDFDFKSATGTFVGFRVKEELVGIGAAEAVGRTGEVTGTATIANNALAEATFEADMSSITTDQSRRDDRVQSALETDQFPTATFTLSAPVALPDNAADGGQVEVTAAGDLTVHGVTKAVSIPLQAKYVNDTIVIVGSLSGIDFTTFGVTMPSAPVVASVDPVGTIELQILLKRS